MICINTEITKSHEMRETDTETTTMQTSDQINWRPEPSQKCLIKHFNLE